MCVYLHVYDSYSHVHSCTCWQVKTNNHVLVVDAVYVNHLLNVTST